MTPPGLYPRLAAERLDIALRDSPAVLIHGPRQCGKTTLATTKTADGFRYLTFDDEVVRQAAVSDPVGFVAGLPEQVILDEVQRIPELFTGLKKTIDEHRVPGRFILTGSTNVLLLPKLADSLAGRMEVLRLHPLAQCELAGAPASFLERLFEADFPLATGVRTAEGITARIIAGGYPAALARLSAQRQSAWYRDYLETMIQRDVRDLARIASLNSLPRLLKLAAAQTARLINVSELAAPLQVSRPTIRDYITLLERVFLLDELPAWHSNRRKRLLKTPKLHVGDSGLACALLGLDADGLWQDRSLLGRLLETFVFQELRRQASGSDRPVEFFHFRDRDGYEVDIVLDSGSAGVVGVEVKAGATVRQSDFKGLKVLRQAAGRRFVAGLVCYDGEATLGFGEHLYAVPYRYLWE